PPPLQRRWQHPVLKRRAVAQSARLASQNRHVMPWIVYGCAAPIAAWMFRHYAPFLADHDALGVGVNVDRAADCTGAHRVFVVVEPDEAGLRHRSRQRMEAVEAAAIGNELRPLLLEHLPDRLVGPLGMAVRLAQAMHLSMSQAFSSS